MIEASGKYKRLEEQERSILSEVSRFLGLMNQNEQIGKILNLPEQQRYSEIGWLIQNKSISERGYMGGLIIEQVGNAIKGMIQTRKMSIIARTRVQCLAMTLVQQEIAQQVEIQKQSLGMVNQFLLNGLNKQGLSLNK